MFEPGTQIGRYQIQRRLGRGGMGTVYAAHDPVLDRVVAIKVLAGDLDIPDARQRFAREARSAAALAHPHIVAIYDFGDHESQPYIVMEYVEGETLAEVIRRRAQASLGEKLRWIEELCLAVGYAHQRSVIHRDIKPANLIIDEAGRLKVLDFGIARLLGTVSNTRDAIGTPGYMAPEQIQGKRVDARADLFSIGVVFYELLSYTEAFPGETGYAITHNILTQDPVPLPRLVPDLDPDLLPIIERALRKNADERFSSADALQAAVSRVRRRSEHDSVVTFAPTILRRATLPPNRGTGANTLPVAPRAMVATPPPAQKRTDREELARRRAMQADEALAQARAFLAVGDLERASDQCKQALMLDENHTGALSLDEAIRVALERRRMREVEAYEDGSDAVGDAAESPEPVAPVEYAPTVIAPPRRARAPRQSTTMPPSEAAPVEPSPTVDSPPPRRLKTTPPRPVKTTPPRPRKTAPPPTPPRPSLLARMQSAAPVVKARLLALVPGPRLFAPVGLAFTGALARLKRSPAPASAPAVPRALITGRNAKITWVAGAVVILAIAIVAVVMLRPAAIAPTGTLVIDAVPWGTVTEIQAENGERQPVPSPASTPLSLGLPAGTYQVLVAAPTPDVAAQRITVRVEPDASIVAPMVRFSVVSPEEYFEQYLAAPSAGTDTVPPPSEAPPPASTPAVTPAGVSQ